MKNINRIYYFVLGLIVVSDKTVKGNEWLPVQVNSTEYIHTVPFPNSVFKYKLRGNQTNGLFLLFEANYFDQSPGHHVHAREDELFYIIQGNVQFIVDGKQFCATTGDYVYVPRNISQGTRIENNQTNPVKIQILLTPSGLEGFLDEIAPLYYTGQNNLTRINDISNKYGITNLEDVQWKDLGCFKQKTNNSNRLTPVLFLFFTFMKIFSSTI